MQPGGPLGPSSVATFQAVTTSRTVGSSMSLTVALRNTAGKAADEPDDHLHHLGKLPEAGGWIMSDTRQLRHGVVGAAIALAA